MCRFHGGAAPQTKRTAQARFAHLVDPAIDQLAKALKSTNQSVVVAAARDILDRNGLKNVKREIQHTTLDLRKLSTDELVLLSAISRKASGGRVPEFLAAREQVHTLARTLRAGKHGTPGVPLKVASE